MKKTLLALSLIGCLVVGLASCNDDPKDQVIVTTSGNNSTSAPTQEGSNNNNSTNTTDETGNGGNQSHPGLQQGGANTEGGFGPIHTPNG